MRSEQTADKPGGLNEMQDIPSCFDLLDEYFCDGVCVPPESLKKWRGIFVFGIDFPNQLLIYYTS